MSAIPNVIRISYSGEGLFYDYRWKDERTAMKRDGSTVIRQILHRFFGGKRHLMSVSKCNRGTSIYL